MALSALLSQNVDKQALLYHSVDKKITIPVIDVKSKKDGFYMEIFLLLCFVIGLIFIFKGKTKFPKKLNKDKFYRTLIVYIAFIVIFSGWFLITPYKQTGLRDDISAIITLLSNISFGYLIFLLSMNSTRDE